MYKDKGLTKIAYIDLKGKVTDIVDNVGGTTLGRPYSSGSFSVSKNGKIAYTISSSDRPADVAIINKGQKNPIVLTRVNDDLLAYPDARLGGGNLV